LSITGAGNVPRRHNVAAVPEFRQPSSAAISPDDISSSPSIWSIPATSLTSAAAWSKQWSDTAARPLAHYRAGGRHDLPGGVHERLPARGHV
jgi:hypothetical protein